MKLTIQQLKKMIKETILAEVELSTQTVPPAKKQGWPEQVRAGKGTAGKFIGDMAGSTGPIDTSADINTPTASPAPYKGLTFKSKNTEAVRNLQKLINLATGWPLDVDGDFGPSTAKMVLKMKNLDGNNWRKLVKQGQANVDAKTYQSIVLAAKKGFAKLVS